MKSNLLPIIFNVSWLNLASVLWLYTLLFIMFVNIPGSPHIMALYLNCYDVTEYLKHTSFKFLFNYYYKLIEELSGARIGFWDLMNWLDGMYLDDRVWWIDWMGCIGWQGLMNWLDGIGERTYGLDELTVLNVLDERIFGSDELTEWDVLILWSDELTSWVVFHDRTFWI